MLKTTLFIAVQCCQCSTMQVKQQKKSSNKWTCVICNQKQSVKKVYAEGYQAKDIRHFVQSFNMSRKVPQHQPALHCQVPSMGHLVEHLQGNQGTEALNPKRRTDWSYYIDDLEDTHPAYLKSSPNDGNMQEPEIEIVTEIPKGLMSKKAKLKGRFHGTNKDSCISQCTFSGNPLPFALFHLITPHFAIVLCYEGSYFCIFIVCLYCLLTSAYRMHTCVWLKIPAEVTRKEEEEQQQQQWEKQMGVAKRGESKWSDYMVESEDSCFREDKASFADDIKIMCPDDLETDVTHDRVEEDIHPDFL